MCCHSRDSTRHPACVLIFGRSNSGKTTLIERLIPRLRSRGLRVGTIKHAHHGFEMDRPGKDSWRHARAGAEAVAIISPTRTAWVIRTPEALSYPTAVRQMDDGLDLILVEGFKRASGPKIVLAPGGGLRLDVNTARCRVGVWPDALRPGEWHQLVAFCARWANGHPR